MADRVLSPYPELLMVTEQAIHQALAASMLEEGATTHRAYVYPDDLEKYDDGAHLVKRIPQGHVVQIHTSFVKDPNEETAS